MKTNQRDTISFVISLWVEEYENAEILWRGSVTNTRSGKEIYFQTRELLDEITKNELPNFELARFDPAQGALSQMIPIVLRRVKGE